MLLDNNANINKSDNKFPSLEVVAFFRSMTILRLLIARDANIEAKNMSSDVALHVVANGRIKRSIKILLEN